MMAQLRPATQTRAGDEARPHITLHSQHLVSPSEQGDEPQQNDGKMLVPQKLGKGTHLPVPWPRC